MIERVLPFDFITQRKAKRFYQEDICDMKVLLQNRDKAVQEIKKLQTKLVTADAELFGMKQLSTDSDSCDLNDVPETND